MAHEEIPELDTNGLRQFGLILGGILASVFGLLLPWKWGWHALPNWYWIGTGATIAVWALLHADSMRGLYKAWMRVALSIGSIINAVILSIVFFLIVTPMGLAGRWWGRDPLSRRFAKDEDTYRVRSRVAVKNHMERTY